MWQAGVTYFDALDSVTSVRVARHGERETASESIIIAAASGRFQSYFAGLLSRAQHVQTSCFMEEIWL